MTEKKSSVNLGFSSGVCLGFTLGIPLIGIMLMQEMWSTISGLYFDYAYEAITFLYIAYTLHTIHMWSKGKSVNTTKIALMTFSFGLLFLPSIYLFMTHQLDLRGLVFNEFDPALSHMPYAYYLPFIALAAVLIPYPDIFHQADPSTSATPSYKAKSVGVMEATFLDKEQLQKHSREFGTMSDNLKSTNAKSSEGEKSS